MQPETTIIDPKSSLAEAIEKMVENSIGALPVCEADGKMVGIISERDILKWFYYNRATPEKTKIKSVMTTDVVVALPEDDIDDILKIMSEKGIRHMPIITGNRVIGILSTRDIVEEKLTECHTQVRYLHDYIAGGPSQ